MEKFSALLTVDAERFSAHPDVALPRLHMEIRRALDTACAASGLAEVWRSIQFLESTGDGILAVLPHEAIPPLIDPFPLQLQDTLAEMAPQLHAAGLNLRLRVALHVGLVDDERAQAPAISTAVTDVCRLLDSEPLRQALRQSDPNVTFVALLLSQEVFSTYIVGGRTTLRESQFTPVTVAVKQFSRPAYLRVPVPSSAGEPHAVVTPQPAVSPSPSSGGIAVNGISINGHGSQNVIGNTVGNDLKLDQS